MMVSLLLSACSDSFTPYNIQLMTENYSQPSVQPNPNLMLHVSDKFENPDLIGGDDSFRKINLLEIIPWLRSRLVSINSLDCVLTNRINLKIAVKKLYTTIDSNVLVGTLVLNAKMTAANGKAVVRNYRGDCKMNFFTLNEKKGIRDCLNTSLDMIILSIKHDICGFGLSAEL